MNTVYWLSPIDICSLDYVYNYKLIYAYCTPGFDNDSGNIITFTVVQ